MANFGTVGIIFQARNVGSAISAMANIRRQLQFLQAANKNIAGSLIGSNAALGAQGKALGGLSQGLPAFIRQQTQVSEVTTQTSQSIRNAAGEMVTTTGTLTTLTKATRKHGQVVTETTRTLRDQDGVIQQVNQSIVSTSAAQNKINFNPWKVAGAVITDLVGLGPAITNFFIRFGQHVRNIGNAIKGLGNELAAVGFRLTFLLSIPIASGIFAAVSQAADFETTLVRIINLTDASAESLTIWRERLLDLSVELGRTPTELAEGLFAITSAGVTETTQAMSLLIAASKASSLGLGELADVAREVTSIINAYGHENVTAAEAVDVLVAIIDQGNVEIDTLAGQLGRVLGLAAEMGVSIQEAGAFIATFTRSGVTADVAVTALRSALSAILKPTDQSRKALAEYGITTQDVRDAIADPSIGLTKTLISLAAVLEDDDEALGKVIGTARGLAGVLFNTGAIADTYGQILENIGDAAGITAEGFERLRQTTAFQADQMKAAFGALATVVGSTVLPFLNQFLQAIYPLVKAFADWVRLNPEMARLAFIIALIAAAIPPLLIVVGLLISSIGTIIGAIGGFISVLFSLLTPVGFITAAFGSLFVLLGAAFVNKLIRTGIEFAKTAAAAREAGESVRETAQVVDDSAGVMVTAAENVGDAWVPAGKSIEAAAERVDLAARRAASGVTFVGPVLQQWRDEMAEASLAIINEAEEIEFGMGHAAAAASNAFGVEFVEGIGEAEAAADNKFVDMAVRAFDWGANIVLSIARGIASAISAVVQALIDLGNWISGQLRPGSPPKLLPDIDDWGTAMMQEWVNGFGRVDLDIFNELSRTIGSALQSMVGISIDEVDLIPMLLRLREVIAGLTNDFGTTFSSADLSNDSLLNLIGDFGDMNEVIFDYVRAVFAAQEATEALAAANEQLAAANDLLAQRQEQLNHITELYARMLDPLQAQLDAIEEERQDFLDSQRIAELQAIIDDPRAPALARHFAELELQEIAIREEMERIEAQQEAETDAIQRSIDAAQAQVEAAQAQVEAAQAQVDAAEEYVSVLEDQIAVWVETNRLITDQIDLLESLKEKAKSVAESVGDAIEEALGGGLGGAGGGAGGPPGTLASSLEEAFDALFGENGILAGKIKEFGTTLGDIFDPLTEEGGLLDQLLETWTGPEGTLTLLGEALKDIDPTHFKNFLKALLILNTASTAIGILSKLGGWIKGIGGALALFKAGGSGAAFIGFLGSLASKLGPLAALVGTMLAIKAFLEATADPKNNIPIVEEILTDAAASDAVILQDLLTRMQEFGLSHAPEEIGLFFEDLTAIELLTLANGLRGVNNEVAILAAKAAAAKVPWGELLTNLDEDTQRALIDSADNFDVFEGAVVGPDGSLTNATNISRQLWTNLKRDLIDESIIPDMNQGIIDNFGGMKDAITSEETGIIPLLMSGITGAFTGLVAATLGPEGIVTTWVIDLAQTALDAGAGFIQGLVDGLTDNESLLSQALHAIFNAALNLAISSLPVVIQDFIRGLLNGEDNPEGSSQHGGFIGGNSPVLHTLHPGEFVIPAPIVSAIANRATSVPVGSAGAMAGGGAISINFGGVTIVTPMDLATFEASARRAIEGALQ